MKSGWFDLFRENGGPTLYAHHNRTSVIGDVTTITLITVFVTLYLAFFTVFPGIRNERFTTFLSVSLSLFVGTAILIGNSGSGWHTAESEIASSYKAFSNEKIMGKLGVYIGLGHVNVTLQAMPIYYNDTMDVNFNERFRWDGPSQLEEEYRESLKKGLPFPILTVAEYLAVDAEGLCWGRHYRQAGYYTSIFLWFSFVLWICMNILLLVVPRYGAYLMTWTGAMMLFSNFVYYWLIPSRPLVIFVEGVALSFEFGWCFWLIIVAGCLCLMIGAAISIIDLIYPHKFSTILEMDYGTPFDRHTIIEDSHETKKKKKTVPRLEEPPLTVGFGGLLRRLSKRDRDRGMDGHPSGHDNYAFEMEAPKSPWRYPHLMFRDSRKHNKSVSFKATTGERPRLEIPGFGGQVNYLRREDSKDSSCSSLSSTAAPHHHQSDLRTLSVPPFQEHFHKKFKRTDSSESSTSSMASFGGIFGRNNSRKKPGPASSSGQRQSSRPQSPLAAEGASHEPHSHAHVVRTDNNQHLSPLATHGGSSVVTSGGVTVSTGSSAHDAADEIAVIVTGEDNATATTTSSPNNAVRRNTAEPYQHTEASMW